MSTIHPTPKLTQALPHILFTSLTVHTHIIICIHTQRLKRNLNSQHSPRLVTLKLIDALFWSRACLVLRVPSECQERR